jgi:hypothetical protein
MTLRRLLVLVAIIVVIGAAYYLAEGRGNEVCTVCLSVQSRTRCATARAGTNADAAEEARRTACKELSPTDAGRATCFASPPTSVQCKTS